MPGSNVETVRAIYDEWSRGNYRGAPQPYAPGITWTTFAGEGDGILLRGRGEIRQWFREFLSQWQDFRVEALELIAPADRVLVVGHQYGIGKLSGVNIDMPVYAVWTFDGDLVIEVLMTRSEAEARAAAGLVEA